MRSLRYENVNVERGTLINLSKGLEPPELLPLHVPAKTGVEGNQTAIVALARHQDLSLRHKHRAHTFPNIHILFYSACKRCVIV